MASFQEPLISNNARDDDDDDDALYDGDDNTRPDPAVEPDEGDGRPSTFVLVLTVTAGISGLLFGYDTGVVSATLVSIGTSLSNRALTSMDKSIITSATSLFALLVSPFSSVIADALGRKRVVLYADVLFVVGALIQACSWTVAGMVLGRCIIGAGVGAASFVVPLYIAEVAPAKYRGRLLTMNNLFITGGQVVAYIIGWMFSTYAAEGTGWRWMVGLGALPAALQGAMVAFMPETPRWLVKVGRSAEAKLVVQRVNSGSAATTRGADAVIKEIEMEAREEQEARRLREHQGSGSVKWLGAWEELLSEGQNRRALAIACLLQGLQQLCGFNSLMYFSATIFTLVGFESPTLTSLTVAITNFLFTLVALTLIDRIGRRKILLLSIPFMILGLLFSAFGFSSLPVGEASEGSAVARAGSEGNSGGGAAVMILVSIMIYVAAYAVGLGVVPWMQSELFPLAVRSLGSGISTATNWGSNFVVGLTFLPLMELLTPPWTFALYAAVCGLGYCLVWRIYPETAGLSLEEATALLEHGWGVR